MQIWKKTYKETINPKKASVAILISDKKDINIQKVIIMHGKDHHIYR